MSASNTQLETVNVRLADGAATVELNRPEVLNAWNAQLGADLLAALRGAAADDAVRAVVITGAGRAFSSGADLKDMSGGAPRRGAPGRLHDAHRALPPDHGRHPRDAQAGPRRGERTGRGHRLLAGALLRSDRGGRERLLPARVREHRAGPRRRLLAVRAHARRHGPRNRDGDARRARGGGAGARVGPHQPCRRTTRGSARRRPRWRRGWRAGRRAPTPGPSASSTTGCIRAWTSSSTWRPGSSRRWPAARTFVEGATAFVEKRPARFSGS